MGTDRTHSDINSLKAQLLGLALPQQIIAALAKHDAEVRFCGGVVRDLMIGQLKWPEPDIDMASPMPPKMAANILKAAGLRVIPTGIAHGTITVMLPSDPACKVELTTLRSDHKTDGRHAEVRFIEDWHADASRRDFTCNSLYMTASGVVIDPFGGLDDLDAGIVRFIGNPNDRIAEDVLRIFRFFRFMPVLVERILNRLQQQH
jgi:poly(A) polymerase